MPNRMHLMSELLGGGLEPMPNWSFFSEGNCPWENFSFAWRSCELSPCFILSWLQGLVRMSLDTLLSIYQRWLTVPLWNNRVFKSSLDWEKHDSNLKQQKSSSPAAKRAMRTSYYHSSWRCYIPTFFTIFINFGVILQKISAATIFKCLPPRQIPFLNACHHAWLVYFQKLWNLAFYSIVWYFLC